MAPAPSIPPTFTQKKATILSSLSAPPSTYTDLSPKGTVDEAIKDLIDRINSLEGIVTTSSCAGRISIFLEGSKQGNGKDPWLASRPENGAGERQAAVPGGKGLGGRWLFVSHEPVHMSQVGDSLLSKLGLNFMENKPACKVDLDINERRLIKFQFEPMILHIMAASLHHAQPVLTAAINSGFRESGIQSLKNLSDPNAFPMIAIRSSGLALESLIGVCLDQDMMDSVKDTLPVDGIITEDGFNVLLKLANARFKLNSDRMRRFEDELFSKDPRRNLKWEDSEVRKTRKRTEGLAKRKQIQQGAETPKTPDRGTANADNDRISEVDLWPVS